MKSLDNCINMFGKISPETKKRIKAFIKKPNFDTWDDIQSIIITENLETIWQAVIALKPDFPRRGRVTDKDSNIIKEWEQIPTPLEVLQAIKLSVEKRREAN